MLNEALYSATYVDNYIDSVENLPDDVQRHLSRIRDIDVQYRNLLRDVDHYYDLWRSLQSNGDTNSARRLRATGRMQQCLIQAQELGDEKMQIVNLLQELIDHKTRQLDTDQKNLDIKEELQQQHRADQMQQGDDCGGPTPAKRTQSPARSNDLVSSSANGSVADRQFGSCAKEHNSNAFAGFTGNGSSGGGGGSTPNSERSGHASNGTTGSGNANGISTAGNTSSANLASSEAQRSVSKRSRRRNENTNNSMELGGNESNSANEGGGNGGSAQKSANSGTGQKKNSTQNQSNAAAGGASSGAAASGSGAGAGGGNNSGKKKKRKARGAQSSSAQANAREETPPQDPIDPDEPTYCVCNQISFGEMILCDNDLCPIEWFHFSCVSLVLKPKGKWFCPNCRGDRPNVMKPKAQFLKELERYNKEKEEKT